MSSLEETQPLLHGSRKTERQNSQPEAESAVFKSKWGLVLSCLGCVVGTGNIWRFPRIVANNSGENGGLQFLLAWVMFLCLWSIPVILIEYSVGRFTRKGPIGSFRSLIGPWSSWCGAWMTAVSTLVGCYYSVVLGWCFYYLFHSIFYNLPSSKKESEHIWNDLQDSEWLPSLLHFLSLLITSLTITRGVSSIERVNTVIVPLLLVIVVISFYWSLTLEYSSYGISYLFTPDWDEFTEPKLWVDAASQNAWDTGAGAGLFLTYATFMSRRNSVVKLGTLIPACNNFISLLCAITLFSTVFSVEMKNNHNQAEIVKLLKEGGHANTGLTFIWMPVLFRSIGDVGGRFLSSLFFLCLALAGISSLVSIMELPVHTLQDMHVPRKYGLPIVFIVMFCGGLASALDLNILVNQDFVWAFGQLLCGAVAISLPLRYGTRTFRELLVNQFGLDDWKLPKIWEYIVKFLDPLIALALLVWFIYDTVNDEHTKWYQFGTESLITCLVEWFVVLFLVVLVNIVWMLIRLRSQRRIHRISSLRDAQRDAQREVATEAE